MPLCAYILFAACISIIKIHGQTLVDDPNSPCFSQIFSYGDSLSDTGNAYRLTNRLFPPQPPYNAGRFSDGPVWIEYLSDTLHVPFTSYAFGGATVNNLYIPSGITDLQISVPSLYDQVLLSFVGTNPKTSPKRLYAIWIGGNDYVNSQFKVNTTELVLRVQNIVQLIVDHGGRNVMIVGLPPIGQTPLGIANGGPLIDVITKGFNDGIETALRVMTASNTLPDGTNLYYADMIGMFLDIINDPVNNFNIKRKPCFDSTMGSFCPNIEDYAFFDVLHPTTRFHRLIAGRIATDLFKVGSETEYTTKCGTGKARMCLMIDRPSGAMGLTKKRLSKAKTCMKSFRSYCASKAEEQ